MGQSKERKQVGYWQMEVGWLLEIKAAGVEISCATVVPTRAWLLYLNMSRYLPPLTILMALSWNNSLWHCLLGQDILDHVVIITLAI